VLLPAGPQIEFRVGGIHSATRVPAAMFPETPGTQRADCGGVSVTRLQVDTEGPRRRTRCWVGVKGISARSERGRASAERPCTRVANKTHRRTRGSASA
jgi:hypothetical protein